LVGEQSIRPKKTVPFGKEREGQGKGMPGKGKVNRSTWGKGQRVCLRGTSEKMTIERRGKWMATLGREGSEAGYS